MHFDIKDLKLFLAISEEGSLTRGAEKNLHVCRIW